MATGLYGKPIPKQNGAPLRLVAPWKYGFKNVKSIVSIEFTDKRPVSFWEKLQSSEYGFWANVNPQVPHPRWSQATEKPLGSDERIPTQLYNGYAEFVAGPLRRPQGGKALHVALRASASWLSRDRRARSPRGGEEHGLKPASASMRPREET